MSYSSNKWKKLQKILRRLLLGVSILTIIYLSNRFSIVIVSSHIDFQDKILHSGYVLIDWKYKQGRDLDAADIVVAKPHLCYIIATAKNSIEQQGYMLFIDNIPTTFVVKSRLPKLKSTEYLVYTPTKKVKIEVVDAKDIDARILMTLVKN